MFVNQQLGVNVGRGWYMRYPRLVVALVKGLVITKESEDIVKLLIMGITYHMYYSPLSYCLLSNNYFLLIQHFT